MDDRKIENYLYKKDIGSVAIIPIMVNGKIHYLEIPFTTKDEKAILDGDFDEIA